MSGGFFQLSSDGPSIVQELIEAEAAVEAGDVVRGVEAVRALRPRTTVLSNEVFDAFIVTLDEPAQPVGGLVELFRRYPQITAE